jgi:hypothetical protein
LYFAKGYKTYHLTTSDLDYWGVIYDLDAFTDEFQELPLCMEVAYLDTNFGLEISRIISGTSIKSYWSYSAYNNDHMGSIGNKPKGWLYHRDTDTYGVLV